MSDEPNFTSQELRDLGLPTYADLRKIADEFHWLADQRGDLLAKRENELDEARAKVAELRAELERLTASLEESEKVRTQLVKSLERSNKIGWDLLAENTKLSSAAPVEGRE